jgi:sporulation protein YlmC with PRC-barrel domain
MLSSMMAGDASGEEHPIHYSAVPRGTPVISSDGVQVGTVQQVVDNYREHILDGFVIRGSDGEVRFADAPEVARTTNRAVTLTIDAEAAAQLPPPEEGSPNFRPRRGGRLSRMLGGGWRRH